MSGEMSATSSGDWWSPDEPSKGKRLPASVWRLMRVDDSFCQPEVGSEQRSNGSRRVALNGQPAAFRRSIGREGRDDRGATGLERSTEVSYIRVALRSVGEEMKNSAIVPDVH
jgi:hypothetical protein